MADDTATTDTGSETDTGTDTATDTGSQTTDIPAEVKRALNKANKEAENLRLKLREYEDRDKTDQQKLEERATAAERDADDARRELLKITVAKATDGLTVEDADLISGTTEDEMKASAARLAERFGGRGTNFDGGARTTTAAPVDMNDMIRRSRAGQR